MAHSVKKCLNEKFNSAKEKGSNVRPRSKFALSMFLVVLHVPCGFRNFCDATDPRPNYVVRFAVQIIYLSRRRIRGGTRRTRAPRATGNRSWSQIRTIGPRTRTRGGKAVSKAQRRRTRKRLCWIPVISSLSQGGLNLRNYISIFSPCMSFDM